MLPNLAQIISDYGYYVIFAFIFAETALLVGFFLPGDTLLVFAGYYAAAGRLDLAWIILIGCIAAITGDSVAYQIGRRGGRRLFKKEESLFFSTSHLRRAEVFFEKHGPLTVMIARPIAFLRTFAPVVAGIGHMNYKKFLAYNIVGGVAWVVAFSFLGWGVGEFLKDKIEIEVINKYVDLITWGILGFSIISFTSLGVYKKVTKGKARGVDVLRDKLED
jgi:membrane-associated protein